MKFNGTIEHPQPKCYLTLELDMAELNGLIYVLDNYEDTTYGSIFTRNLRVELRKLKNGKA